MKYDAFISYRHTPLDMEFAKKVHGGLETYHVPGAVQKKTGKKKIQRVFRDQEELPIGSDLNENISEALRESEYLIVICSPETPGSYWVCKEIETFIEMHDRQHILAVLVAGEPDESFPPALLSDEEGNAVEPLAADVRGETPAERNKKFKTELLRLAAPILGCTYDDLRQRHRERILKRNILIGAVTAGILAIAGTGFGIYNARVASRMKKLADEKAQLADEKSNLANEKSNLANEMSRMAKEKSELADAKTQLADDILTEYKEKQVNQSRFYAEEAMTQFRQGNLSDAVLIASAGLPSADHDRPYVAEAEYALASALHAYDSGSELSFDRILGHDHFVRDMRLDGSGRYLATIDEGKKVYAWDLERGELLLKLVPQIGDENLRPSIIDAYANVHGIVVVYSKELVRYDYSGTEVGRQPWDVLISECSIDEDTDTIVLISSKTLSIVSLSDFSVLSQKTCDEGYEMSKNCEFSKDGQWMAFGQISEDEVTGGITIVNRKTDASVTVSLSQPSILDMVVTDLGNVAVITTNSDFFYKGLEKVTLDLIRASDGKIIYSLDIPCSQWEYFDFKMRIAAHSHDGQSDIVLASDCDAYSIDEASGKTKAHIALPGSAVSIALAENSDTMSVCCRNGDIIVASSDDGKIYSTETVSSGISSEDMKLLDGGIILREKNSPRVMVLKHHTAYDLQELPGLAFYGQGLSASPSAQYYVLAGNKTGEFYFYDPDGKCIHTIEVGGFLIANGFLRDQCILVTRRGILLIDPLTQTEKEIAFKDLGIRESYSYASLTENGRYLTVYSAYVGAVVIDLEEERCIFTDSKDESIGNVALSGDGRYLVTYGANSNLEIVDITTGERTKPKDPNLWQFLDAYNFSFLACDENGRYAAMACADGYVRILSLLSGEILQEIPLQTDLVCFLRFTKDSQHILMQGGDRRVKIYDLTDWTCKNIIEVSQKIAYAVEDEGRIALCDNENVTLLDAESFGHVADVTDAAVYLQKIGTFILVNGRDVSSTKYKPYSELLLEAERQYPGAKLSEEKKVRYNID